MKRRDHQEKNYAAAVLSIDCVSWSNPPRVSCFSLTEPVIRTSKKNVCVWTENKKKSTVDFKIRGPSRRQEHAIVSFFFLPFLPGVFFFLSFNDGRHKLYESSFSRWSERLNTRIPPPRYICYTTPGSKWTFQLCSRFKGICEGERERESNGDEKLDWLFTLESSSFHLPASFRHRRPLLSPTPFHHPFLFCIYLFHSYCSSLRLFFPSLEAPRALCVAYT